MELLFVDGYNIIGAWPDLRTRARDDLEDARIELTERLYEYASFTSTRVVLVFDAHLSGRLQRSEETRGNLRIVYTKSKETADHYIEKSADRYSGDPRYLVRVATGDALEQATVLSRGAARVSARELAQEIGHARAKVKKTIEKKPIKPDSSLEARLSADQLKKLREMFDEERKE